VTSWTEVMEWVYLLALAQEGASVGCDFRSGDLLAIHQRKCTLGKMETFSRLASDEVTNLWVKLCNLFRV
jgi:hypothetical protein